MGHIGERREKRETRAKNQNRDAKGEKEEEFFLPAYYLIMEENE